MTKIYENISTQICTKRRYSKKVVFCRVMPTSDGHWAAWPRSVTCWHLAYYSIYVYATLHMFMQHPILLHTCIYATMDIMPSMYKLRTHCKYVFVRCPCQWSIYCIRIGPAIPYLQMCYFWTYVCTYINHRWWTIINPNLLTKCAGKANCLLHVSPFSSDRFGRGLTDWDLIRDKSRPESIQI